MLLEENLLNVSKIHSIYYATYGNKNGIPLLFIHGGPGGCSEAYKQLDGINLDKFYAIVYDQRGCGKSIPLGELRENEIQEQINDIYKLLEHLKIKKVALVASSWGSCLSLIFAEAYPEKISKMFLRSTFLGRKKDSEWLYKGSKEIFPDLYEKFMRFLPDNIENPAKFLLDKIENSSFEEKQKITSSMSSYEYALMLMVFSNGSFRKPEDIKENDINSTRIFLHYEANRFFIEDNQIINNCEKIKDIPIIFYHGRFDMDCQLGGVYELHKKLPNSSLTIIPYESHIGTFARELIKKDINAYAEF